MIFCFLPQQFALVGAITCQIFHASFPNLLCMLQMTSSQKNFMIAEKIQKWLI